MRTTINALVDRRGGAYSAEELQDVLNRARRILADTSALLEHEIERLFETEIDVSDEEQMKRIKNLIAQTQKCVQQVLDIEAEAGLSVTDSSNSLDLDEAREEITRRIARLVD